MLKAVTHTESKGMLILNVVSTKEIILLVTMNVKLKNIYYEKGNSLK